MKIKFTLPAFFVALLLITSCKKDDNTNNNNTSNQNNPLSQALGGSPTIPTGANGALYAVINHVLTDDGSGGTDTTDLGTAYAWFESYTNTKDVGTVSCNTIELDHTLSGFALPWYYTLGYVNLDVATPVEWDVQGNSANGVTGFTHTDATAYPTCNFSVPSSVNLNNTLTITWTNNGSNDGVFVSIYGSSSAKVTKTIAANGTTASFTSSELRSVTSSGYEIGIQVMPVKLTQVTLNSKSYYFVKQYAFAQFSTAL